jgi:hypothetical protein
MNKGVEINIVYTLRHYIKAKASQQSQRVQYKLSLLREERNKKSEIRIDNDRQQNVSKDNLHHKLPNASHFNQPELRIEMKSNGDQPKENMIKPISPELFHIQK